MTETKSDDTGTGDAPQAGDLWPAVERHLIRYAGDFLPVVISRASGSYVYDRDGQAILDFTSGQMCAILGHNHPALRGAVVKALDEVVHLYSNMLSPPVIRLAAELAGLLPSTLQKGLFLSTGGEANEAALRMAKLKTGGFEIVAKRTPRSRRVAISS